MTYRAVDLELKLVEAPDVSLERLFHRTGAEWDEPPPTYRTMRYDPPLPHQADYALLYMALPDFLEIRLARLGGGQVMRAIFNDAKPSKGMIE